MTHAYDPNYLEQSMRTMGSMLDAAVLDLRQELSAFYQLFLSTGIGDRFASGEADLLVGKSGFELASIVLEKANGTYPAASLQSTQHFRFGRTPEYWTGWALSYFQWESGQTFSQIQRVVPIDEIRGMYEPFHEMDILQFSDRMHQYFRERQPGTQLKRLRIYADLTQKALSEKTGIPLRTIQQYEQRQKNLSRASGYYLRKFANALNCRMEDLIEDSV